MSKNSKEKNTDKQSQDLFEGFFSLKVDESNNTSDDNVDEKVEETKPVTSKPEEKKSDEIKPEEKKAIDNKEKNSEAKADENKKLEKKLEKKQKKEVKDIDPKVWKILFFITLGVAGVFLILLIVLIILLNTPPTNIF